MLLPFRKLYPSLYWKMEGLFFNWLLAMVTMWSWTAGYDRKSYVQMKEFDFETFYKILTHRVYQRELFQVFPRGATMSLVIL